MLTFKNIFFIFFFYSIIGWIVEIIDCLIIDKRFVNRGFLIGPYCPIYGFGCTFITICLSGADDFASLFLKSALICSVLEYFTSYIMEKIFQYRWWDYSNRKFNINGRICLETTIPFGLGACLIIKVVNPILFKVLGLMGNTLSTVLFILLALLIILDTIFSIFFVSKINDIEKNVKVDSTEELKAKMLGFIKKGKTFYKRIFDSFPKLKKTK